jgi:hypothetical protein
VAAPALDVRLELPERVAAGDPIGGRLTVSNTGEEPASVVSPFGAAVLSLVVFDRLWNLVQPAPVAKVHVAEERTELAAGASLAWELPDLSFVTGTAQMRYSLAPGTYHVLAVYHPGTERLPERSTYPTVAVSEVVPLEVAEPA